MNLKKVKTGKRINLQNREHKQVCTHLLTASVRACWLAEDPYSRPCKAVQRPGGVTHAETHTADRIRAHHCGGNATETLLHSQESRAIYSQIDVL